jgi:hypothetical protein
VRQHLLGALPASRPADVVPGLGGAVRARTRALNGMRPAVPSLAGTDSPRMTR